MTELAEIQTQTAIQPATNITNFGGGALTKTLVEYAVDLDAAFGIAERICKTPFAPKDFQGKPEAAAAAILKGYSLGLPPMESLDAIFIVYGRPAMYARTMTALLIAKGGEIERLEATPERVVVRARLNPRRAWQEFEWDMERAKLAGYTSNAKYRTNPVEMLYAKVSTEAVRTVAPHLLAGMPSAEEVWLGDLEEIVDEPAQVKPEPKKARGTRVTTTRKRRTEPADEAPQPAAEEAPAETGEVATEEQIEDMRAIYTSRGHTQESFAQALQESTGRQDVKTPSDLTRDEAEAFIEKEVNAS